MGLFNRKISNDGDSVASTGTRSSIKPLNSPPLTKFTNGSAFSIPSLPDVTLPKPPDPHLDPAAYLRSLNSVRARSKLVFSKAKRNQLAHFHVDLGKFKETASYVVSIIKRDYAPDYQSIPAHGRWQHFEVGGRPRVDQLLASWPTSIDNQEKTRRLIDLFLVSVLLDAGAGNRWSYKSKESGKMYRRSEGLAVASLEMFKAGLFSSDPTEPCQVDGAGLRKLTVDQLAKGMQVSDTNIVAGLEGRAGLLSNLADALNNQKLFGVDARPGNMLDYLLSHPSTQASSVPIITIPTLWNVLTSGLGSIWPTTRTQVDGTSIGDAWPCSSMPASPPAQYWESIVPFHKLTQWLCYSLMTPMTKLLQIRFAGTELLTGLPEYRNGGLLVDTGLLTLKADDANRGVESFRRYAKLKGHPCMEIVPLFTVDDDVIVEWRAVTIGFLDELLLEVNRMLLLQGDDRLTLAQMLEAGTWKVREQSMLVRR
ncbi:hypothetical protein MMC12_008227 [Toensbergia leucococca]|nr:hypothetical protein [Toensbergia leucococca]